MTKRLRYILIAIAIAGGGYFAADWLHTNALRVLMMTTADPDTLGQVQSDSMQPITLTLESDHIAQVAGPAPTAPTDQRISIRIPTAYVTAIYLKEGRSGSQRIEFEVWNRTFDPVAPDKSADSAKCRVGTPCYEDPSGRGAQRRQQGELPLQIQIGNGVSASGHRNYVLNDLDGVRSRKPCQIGTDTRLGMIVAETPDGLRPGDACNFIGNPGIRRDGKSFPPKNFLKLEPDGTPVFVVHCSNFSSEEAEQPEIKCKLHSYFGVWPLTIQFCGIPPSQWNDMYRRVQEFLVKHVIERTALGASTKRLRLRVPGRPALAAAASSATR